MRRFVLLSAVVALLWPRAAGAAVPLIAPVDAAVVRHFDPPAGAFGPGHRGVDFSVVPGVRVRAAGRGKVTFAGSVAGTSAVTIGHGAGLETTYSQLAEVWVRAGDVVEQGTWLGTAGSAHGAGGGLHFGVKVDDVYVDPAGLMVPGDLGGALRLAPLLWEPSEDVPEPLAAALAPRGPGSARPDCVPAGSRSTISAPPNDNIAVAVAGIASKTEGRDAADMYHPGPRFFGYAPDRIYLFSYRGVGGPRLHRDYARRDTFKDIRHAATKLEALLRAIGERHPGADVDLFAHSQGGVVARTYLTRNASVSAHDLPRVEHFVTFATPHRGAPAASNVEHLRTQTLGGPALLAAASAGARAGLPLPDPNADSVHQLAPGSVLLDELDRRDIAFGTRALTLGITNDLVVPADRTALPGHLHRDLPPEAAIHFVGGVALPGNGHSAIVTSPVARAYVYDFLRGRPPSCPTTWDTWAPRVGRAVGAVESHLGRALSHIEGPAGRLLRSFDT